MTPEQLSERGRISMAKMPHEDHVRAGYKTKEGWGRTPEAQEQRLRAGRIGSRKAHEGGWLQTHEGHIATQRGARITNCFRWHSDRPKVNRLCAECAAKTLHD
jgi:hypothetical protein